MTTRDQRGQNQRGRPPHRDILTPAEWKVTEGVRHGLSNPQIADRQGVSLNAVKFHVANILAKLNFKSRAQLKIWDGVRMNSHVSANGNSTAEGFSTSLHLDRIGQIARFVTDIDAATTWYRDTLGMTHLYQFDQLSFFDCNGLRIFLNVGDPKLNSILYFQVADIHQTHKMLLDRGVKIVSAPHMIHQHDDGTEEWMAFFNDPDGAPLGLMSRAAPEPGQS